MLNLTKDELRDLLTIIDLARDTIDLTGYDEEQKQLEKSLPLIRSKVVDDLSYRKEKDS